MSYKKYAVLAIFCLFTMNNGFAWLMFDPVVKELKANVRGVDDEQLELLSSWQPIMYILAFFPMTRIITEQDGLRRSVRVGATFELVGSVLKLFAIIFKATSAALPLLHLGQMCSAVASPVAIGAVSALSASWFEPEERTRSTAAAVLFNNVGNAVCYLAVPPMTSNLGYISVVGYEVALGIIAFALAWLLMPASRALRQAMDQQEHEEGAVKLSLVGELRELFGYRSAVLLFLVYSWSSGGYVAWTSLFDEMLNSYYDSLFIGRISFVGTVAYVVGGMVSSYLTDKYFRRRMKAVIVVCCAANTVSCVFFTLAVPSSSGKIVMDFGKGWILFVAGLCGLFNGGAAPVFYELVAEITFPVDEGVSGNVMSMCENIGALVIYQVVARVFKASAMNYAFTVGMAVAVGLGLTVSEQYRRANASEEEQQTTHDLLAPFNQE